MTLAVQSSVVVSPPIFLQKWLNNLSCKLWFCLEEFCEVSLVLGDVCFSAFASAWNLLFSWRVKGFFALGSFSFLKSNRCCIALPDLSPRHQFQGYCDKMVVTAVISFWPWHPGRIFSMSCWSSGGQSGSCLFHRGSTRWDSVGRVSLRWPDSMSCRIQVSLSKLLFMLPRILFPTSLLWFVSHSSRPSLSSSHCVICLLAGLATAWS